MHTKTKKYQGGKKINDHYHSYFMVFVSRELKSSRNKKSNSHLNGSYLINNFGLQGFFIYKRKIENV